MFNDTLYDLHKGNLANGFSPKHRSSDQETAVTGILDQIVRHSNALDTESLCIVKGVSCWTIRADLTVVDYDGNLTDASCIALMTALKHFRRPDAVVRDGKVIVYKVEDRVPVPLNITHHPLTVSFNFFHKGQRIIIDASRLEEAASDGEFVLGINGGGEVAFASKLSGMALGPVGMLSKVEVAKEKAKAINAQMDQALEIDLAKRAKLGMEDQGRAANDR